MIIDESGEKMKEIGILTFHRAHNYGAVLQAYALQKKTDSFIIDYYNPYIYNQYKLFKPLRKNLIRYISSLINDFRNYKVNKKRYISFEKVISKFPLISQKEINDLSILITGSDQVWNPNITGGLSDIYTLNFGKEKVKRISYAASIGNINNVEKYKKEYKDKLSKLDKISVREESAKIELEKILPYKKIDIVLDPTLLLTEKEWSNEIKNIKTENKKYILAYVVEENDEFIKIVNDLSKKTGLGVIHFGQTNPGYDNEIKSYYTSGPFEFISLIKNAEYIVATSFHATVFSIIFNKKFWIVPHKTTGSRVIDFLNKLGISNRAVNTLAEFNKKNYDEEIDYDKVNKILEKEREKSIKWLTDAIEK